MMNLKDGEIAFGVEYKDAVNTTLEKGIEEFKELENALYFVCEKNDEDPKSVKIEYDAFFFICPKEKVFKIIKRQSWSSSHYISALHYKNHFELNKKMVEFRQDRFQDIESIDVEIENDIYNLNFVINTNLRTNLEEAYKYGYEIEKWINSETDKLHSKVGQFYIEAIKRMDEFNLIEIPELVRLVESAEDSNIKGKVLETLIHKLFENIDGFKVKNRILTATEELDLVVFNNSNLNTWKKESQIILVECKNWSSKCGKNELVVFEKKLENRRNRVKLGFLISWNGFSMKLKEELLRSSKSEYLVILLDGKQIKDSIQKPNGFQELLESSWLESITI